MWKDSVELKVIRLEGFPCSSTELALYFYLEDVLFDQLLPINEEKSLLMHEEGLYRLEIVNQNTQESKTISFNRSLFKEDGVKWLPLFSQSQDFIDSLPEEVSLPRILLIFYRKRMLNMLKPQISIEDPPSDPVPVTNYEINEEPLISKVDPDDKILQDYKKALEYERKLRDDQEKSLQKLSSELSESIKRSQLREDSLLQLISVKEEELLAAQTEIMNLRAKIRKVEYESSQLSDVIESLRVEKECLNFEGVRKELEMFTHYFKDCEEMSIMKAQLEAFENKESAGKELEDLISEALKGKNVQVKKENEAVYTIFNKKIAVCFREGGLGFRVLGGLQKFEELFVVGHERSLTPSNKLHRRNGSDVRNIELESKDSVGRRINTSFSAKKVIKK